MLYILPSDVVEELKVKGQVDAKMMDEVTVLFTDFKGFTAMAQHLTPKQLVADINECFSAFDLIIERHGIEKDQNNRRQLYGGRRIACSSKTTKPGAT